MKEDLFIKEGIVIPAHEIEITASRSGGPGGQFVNKTSSRVSVRWNVRNTVALNDIQKERVLEKFQNHLTNEGDLIVHNSQTRSQVQNKKHALDELAQKIRDALYVAKRRMKTRIPHAVKQTRLEHKARRSNVKKMRQVKIDY